MPTSDVVYTGSSSTPTMPVDPVAPDAKPELLEQANKEIYKRNFELSIRNKTLSVLRSLYAIAIASLDVNAIAQQIVDTIVKELSFTAAIISILDKKNNCLRPIAITQSPEVIQALTMIGKSLREIEIPLDAYGNVTVTAIRDRERKVTENLYDILVPLASQDIADEIAAIVQIKTILVYPLIVGTKAIGTLQIGLAKKPDDLSFAEKESLEELVDVVGFALDRAELHEELQRANEKLKLLDKLKDDFVSLASHELRTPMTAIKSYSWLMLNGKTGTFDPKAKEYLDRIFISTERLISLVNDMLDISRIESGRVQLKVELTDMKKLVLEIMQEFQARASEKGLKIESAMGDIPQVPIDPEKIHQVIENLVGNSLKFTPQGGTITISSQKIDSYIEMRVTDTGKGIAPEDLERLFKKFGRLENSLTSTPEKGTGLGLYICKQYVELHGGKISVEATLGQGATFIFTLPLKRADPIS